MAGPASKASDHAKSCIAPSSIMTVSYIDMAVEAVKALKERGGSSSQAIKKVGAARPRAPHFGRAEARPRAAASESTTHLNGFRPSEREARRPLAPPPPTSSLTRALRPLPPPPHVRSTSRRTTSPSRSSSTFSARPSRPARPRAPSCRSRPRSSCRRPPRSPRRRRRCVS